MEQKMRQFGRMVKLKVIYFKKEKISFDILFSFKHKHTIKNSVPVITESYNQLVLTYYFLCLWWLEQGYTKKLLDRFLDLMLSDFSSNQIVNISHYCSLLAIVNKYEQNWISVNSSSVPPCLMKNRFWVGYEMDYQ